MRILIISKYFPPENSIASLRPYSWAKYWSREGHDVTVLTTPKKVLPESLTLDCSSFSVVEVRYRSLFYTFKNFYKNCLNKKSSEDINITDEKESYKVQSYTSYLKRSLQKIDGFRVNRGIFITARMPDITDLWINPATNWAKKQGNWDLVVSTHGPYACHIVAHNLKKSNKVQFWIADFRDLWTDNHIYKGVFPFTLLEKRIEKKAISQANAITTVSKPLAATLANKYGKEKTFVVENGFDSEDLTSILKTPIFNDNKIRIVYTGTIYKGKQDPSPLFESIFELAHSDINNLNLLDKLEVLFVGPTSSLVLEMANAVEVTKWVKASSLLPRSDVLRMQRDADALLFLEFDNGKTDGILTGKLFEYLNSSTEIWGIGVSENSAPGKIILEARAGKIFGKDKSLIKKELIRLLSNQKNKNLDLNNEFIKSFERKHLAESMLKIVNKNV